jgi:hypothetical protein
MTSSSTAAGPIAGGSLAGVVFGVGATVSAPPVGGIVATMVVLLVSKGRVKRYGTWKSAVGKC